MRHRRGVVGYVGLLSLIGQLVMVGAGWAQAPGTIITVAGGGVGDDLSAIEASLNAPSGVSVDSSGNLFIADAGNNRIRKVDGLTGIISTVAGNGNSGFSGDGGLATDTSLNFPSGVSIDGSGNLFVADKFNNRIRKSYW